MQMWIPLRERLWALALQVEDGDLADAAEALQRAQDKLAEAIRNGASPDDIQRLMDEMRQAQDRYMRELAERAPAGDGPPQGGESLSQSGLDDMMQQLQDLMEQGRMAEAQELLDQINRMMENLQMSQGAGGEGAAGKQAMDGLADTLRQQQDLSDDAFRGLQDGQGEGPPDADALAQRQQQLRQQLDSTTPRLAGGRDRRRPGSPPRLRRGRRGNE